MAIPTLHTGDNLNETFTLEVKRIVDALTVSYLTQTFRNLSLRTHPDADVMLKKVWMVADEVVMDDGTRLAYTTPVTADVTASGAGGLDTGSEGASRWYEIYAIAKDDGTKNLLLHRAKDYLSDQSFTTATSSRALRLATSTASDKLAQSFQPSLTGLLEFADIFMAGAGAVVGRVWITLEADSAGSPSGTPLATSDKLDASQINVSRSAAHRMVFRVPVSLTASTTYWLVLQGDYTRSDTVFIQWYGAAAGGYAGGSAKQYNGTTWSATTGIGDQAFKTYVTENDIAVTMPATYTKKCKTGYVFNNSGSDFATFVAKDRRVFCANTGAVVSAVGTNTPVLYDVSSFLPPVPVVMRFATINSVSDNNVIVSGVPHGFAGFNLLYPGLQNRIYTHTGVLSLPQEDGPTEYQGLYAYCDSGTASVYIGGYQW